MQMEVEAETIGVPVPVISVCDVAPVTVELVQPGNPENAVIADVVVVGPSAPSEATSSKAA